MSQYGTVWDSVALYRMIQHASMVWYGMALYLMMQHANVIENDMVWHNVVWYAVAWYTAWCGIWNGVMCRGIV